MVLKSVFSPLPKLQYETKTNWINLTLFEYNPFQTVDLHASDTAWENQADIFFFLPQQSSSLSKMKSCCTGEDLLPLDTVTCPLQFLN